MNESEYVKKDVYDANSQRLEALMEKTLAEQKAMNAEIRGELKNIHTRIDGVIDSFGIAVDGINTRLDDLKDNQSQRLTFWGIVVAIAVCIVQVVISVVLK